MKFLRNIAEAFTGHTLRSKVQNDPEGNCFIIQLKDVNYDNTKLNAEPHKILLHDIPSWQLLRKGDILLLSKGTNNKALLYEGQFETAMAASAFTIIRVNTNNINPEFLAWYINSAKAQEYFNTQRAGTTTMNLSKKAIEELQVPVPSHEKQELMMKLARKYEEYRKLAAEYERYTKLLVDKTLTHHLNDQ